MKKILESIIKISSMGDGVYKYTLETCQELTKSKIAYFHFLTQDQKTLSLFLYSDNTKTFCSAPGKETHYPVADAGWWAESIRLRKPVIHNDTIKLSKKWPEGHVNVYNHLGVPIFDDGEIICVLGVGNKDGDYTENDIDIIKTLSIVAWNISKNKNKDAMSLRAIIPICSKCKKIKDDESHWERVEEYISQHSNIEFSHGLCNDCLKNYEEEIENM